MRSYATAFRYAFIVALGGFIFGLDAALISGTVAYVTVEFGLSDLQIGTVVSAPGFGVIFALLATGVVAARLGRKKTLIIIAALYLVSAVTSTIAPTFEALVAARFLGGLAFTSLSLASMYIGEIAPAHMRGKLVSMNQVQIAVGLFAAYLLNYAIQQASQSGAPWVESVGIVDYTWRWMLGTEIIPAVIWLVLLLYIPESPRWLLQNGKEDEARAVMSKLLPADEIEPTVAEIRESAGHGHDARSILSQLGDLFDKRMRTAFWIGLTIAVVQPITGINSILFYAPTVFAQTGVGADAAYAQPVIMGVVSVVFTVLAVLLVDRIGRRLLTLIGLTWAAASLITCALVFANATYVLDASVLASLGDSVNPEAIRSLIGIEYASDVEFKSAIKAAIGEAGLRANETVLLANATDMHARVVLVAIISFIAAFNFSIGPILWILFSEIFPIYVRSVAIPSFALVTSVVNYLVNQFFPWQLSNMGAAEIFGFYAICVVVGLVILFFILPETKNKSIEQIEAELCGPKAT